MHIGETNLTKHDIYLFNEGRHFHIYNMLGAQRPKDGREGVHFAVWAPNAKKVSVIGDFNGWDPDRHDLHPVESSGIWAGMVPEAKLGDVYKYYVRSHHNDHVEQKADPVGFCTECPPKSASVVWDLSYDWNDGEWMEARKTFDPQRKPVSIYEMHLGSWKRRGEDEDYRSLSYHEIADELIPYLKEMNYTHVEFMPVMEHPFYGSWGYQVTGYFAPTRRYGDPQLLMELIDRLHQEGIGVILDWVPSHFPTDGHGLGFFDGTHLYEHSDPRKGFHPDWSSWIFNYGRDEVRSFLISSAMFWLEKYHVDGLRVDGVASIIYLDYSRQDGEWIPNQYGGNENLEALRFLRELNETVYAHFPGIQMIAEESTAWPMVSKPTSIGGLGFGMKWDMGWMHDTLEYFRKEPIHRKYHQNDITFRSIYQFHENFVLSLSHDEVVHGKGSLMEKMPGDDWQRFANLRCLYAYMYAQSGKKLLFMGGDYGQWEEWKHDQSLNWHQLDYAPHQQIQRCMQDLNAVYRDERAMHELDFESRGFEWIDASDYESSVLSFVRKPIGGQEMILCAFNFTPVLREGYRIGAPMPGEWVEIFNSDSENYGGGDNLNGIKETSIGEHHGRPQYLDLTLPPLGATFLKWKSE
ncbi:MAG: 1,4-alpha-glucan branching protein GlgB [Alphaproteobacteria bacterium]|nr:1,4-alpha-glucan branching protein GlgB [Alphaproteobacteria bacterium]